MTVLDAKLIFEPTLNLDPLKGQAKKFVIVGAGGNGGYLIPNFLRQIQIQNAELELQGKRKHVVVIIDGDEVESKNLVRQNFVQPDIGRFKAEVMAKRYSRAFGVEVDFVNEYLTDLEMLEKIVGSTSNARTVLVGAVDNNKTREILNAHHKKHGGFYIDGGNEEIAGQVVLGFKSTDDRPQLPSIVDLYPEVGDGQDKLPTELSCAEAAESAPQNIMTNIVASNIMMTYLNKILTGTDEDGIKSYQVTFNSQVPSFQTSLNKKSILDTIEFG